MAKKRGRTGSASAKNRPRTAFKKQKTRNGFSSVARTRGAAVTGEMKYFDTTLTNGAIAATTTTWVAGTLLDPGTTIDLGDAAVATPGTLIVPKVSAALNGRIGRKINLRKIKLNCMINIPPQAAQNAADTSTRIRCLLVQDMQSNAASMTSAQLMRDSASGANSTINSFQNPDNFGRFRVLQEKRFDLGNLNLAGSPTSADVIQNGIVKSFKMGHNFRGGQQINFNAVNGGTVADVIDNSFHVIAACNNATYAPTLSYYARCAYKE